MDYKQKIKEYIILLIFIGFIAYLPSLFGNFIWDDEDFITQNQYVKTFQIDKFFTRNAIEGRGKMSNYYRPIQFTVYALIYKVAGLNPFVFHLVGIVLHISAAVLLFLFLLELSKSRIVVYNDKTHISIPFIITLIFLIHPIQTESVTYISGLSDALFSCFMFLSLLFFIQKPRTNKQIILSIIFFIFSLLSKELGIMTLGIMFWIIIIFKNYRTKKNIYLFVILSLIGMGFLFARTTFLQFDKMNDVWEGAMYGSSIFVRLRTFFHNFFIYISLILFPKNLFMERDFSIQVLTSVINTWTLLFILLIITLVIVIWIVKRDRNILLFFFLTFLTCMLPFTGIMLLNGIFYEHFLYIPLLFFSGFVMYLLYPFFSKKTGIIILSVILFLFFIRSYIRQFEWIDNIRFYEQTLSHAPKSTRIINNLGMEYASKGRLEDSIAMYQQGIHLDPSIPNLYHNTANTYRSIGNVQKAEEYYKLAILKSPSFVFSYYSLIDLYAQTNQQEKKNEWIKKAQIQFPQNDELNDVLNDRKVLPNE